MQRVLEDALALNRYNCLVLTDLKTKDAEFLSCQFLCVLADRGVRTKACCLLALITCELELRTLYCIEDDDVLLPLLITALSMVQHPDDYDDQTTVAMDYVIINDIILVSQHDFEAALGMLMDRIKLPQFEWLCRCSHFLAMAPKEALTMLNVQLIDIMDRAFPRAEAGVVTTD